MTEAEWEACTDPQAMLSFLRGCSLLSDRKARMFAAACCRNVWGLLKDARSREAVEAAERYCDALASADELEVTKGLAYAHADDLYWEVGGHIHTPLDGAAGAAGWVGELQAYTAAARAASDAAWAASYSPALGYLPRVECAAQCRILRDIFGNPFRPPRLDSSLRSPAVVVLAQAAYDDRLLPAGHLVPARLVEIAAALQAAGCVDAVLLGHLRGPGPHVRGCWPVDLPLDRR